MDIPPYFYLQNDRAVTPPTQFIEASHSDGWSPIQGAFWRAGKIAPGFDHNLVLENIFQHAVHFIGRQGQTASDAGSPSEKTETRNAKPFFLYVALTGPHTPWLPAKRFQGRSMASMYGDFVLQVDDGVGRIQKALRENGLEENTIFLFTSDNGPVWYESDAKRFQHRSTHHFRGMKGDAWEGGHRVPLIARWPGKIAAGTTSDHLVCQTDFFRTLKSLIGDTSNADIPNDSYDFSSVLLQEPASAALRDTYVMRSSGGKFAIRHKNWKLIEGLGSGGFSKPRNIQPQPNGPQGQLYDLDADPSESNNRWAHEPERIKELTSLLQALK